MWKKSLVVMFSVLLVLSLQSGAEAVTDPAGDNFVSGVDLESAEVLFYPPSITTPEWVRLTVKMQAGNHLPGMIIWDFDADANAATGAGSALNIPFPPCPPTRCKTDQGFDFFIVMILRDQSDTAQNAYCSGCVGGQTCVTRGDPVLCF